MTPRFFPRNVTRGAIAAGALAALMVAGWSGSGANAAVWRLLGIGNVPPASMPRAVTIALPAHAPAFGPPAAAVMSGGQVTFVNGLAVPILVRSTTSAPAPFAMVIRAHARATVTLRRPGLYHYYDASTARPSTPPAPASLEYPAPTGYNKPSDVIVPKAGSGLPRQGWIAVLDRTPGLLQQLTIPAAHAVFTPKLLVAVAGSTISVVNHDEYAHNFVVDSASPTGAAFMIDGTHDTPTHGARRALVLQQPGLYHVYCTLHTQMAGMTGGWHDVTVRPASDGWGTGDDHDPMEAWIIVLPATVTT